MTMIIRSSFFFNRSLSLSQGFRIRSCSLFSAVRKFHSNGAERRYFAHKGAFQNLTELGALILVFSNENMPFELK
ncbi:hypothetical protein [Cohnella herbarum]|uniref:Uncharacterized protein n=1 Tax=Cohnella herbarum TaxID=2728023 RepID=A0A7Z2VKX5_9BACL|nr:hypothetical protein [Cohnella herbarum]QJD85158.1 hypothetical protein HH215_19590 [Cohnella herbarum]